MATSTKIENLLKKIFQEYVWLQKVLDVKGQKSIWCILKDNEYIPSEISPSPEERRAGNYVVCMMGGDGKYVLKNDIIARRKILTKCIGDLEFLENYTQHYQGKVPHFTFPTRTVQKEIKLLVSEKNVFDLDSLGIVRKIYNKDYWSGLNEYYITIDGEKVSEKSNVTILETNLATVDSWESTERLKTLERYGINSRQVVDFSNKKIQIVFQHPLVEGITLVVEGYEIWNMGKGEDGTYGWVNL